MFRTLITLLFASNIYAGELEDQLFKAIRDADAKTVTELLNNPDEKKRADPSAKDKDGTPAIIEALQLLDPTHPLYAEAREKIFVALLRAKPDLDAKNAVGETVLIEAIRSLGGRKHVIVLLRAGANPNIPGRLWTPLFEASMRGDVDVARSLLEYQARVDEGEVPKIQGRPTKRRTPLMIAVVQGEGAVAEILFEAGASIDRKDGSGQSVRDLIRQGKGWQNDELKKLTEREIVILEGLRPFLSKPLAKLVVGYGAGCTTNTDCGAPGSGAICMHSKCLQWEMGRKGAAPEPNWGAANGHCESKRTETEHWRLPTKSEEKYLCRKDENYPDHQNFRDGCPHAKQVLGSDFEDGFFWSSTCWDRDQPSRESSASNPCSIAAWGVGFASGSAISNYVDSYHRVRCVRDQ